MMILNTFFIILPILIVGIGGYLLSCIFDLSEETLVRIVTDFFMPILVFHSLYTSEIDLSETVNLLAAVTVTLLILFCCALLYCHFFKLDFKSFSPPILFMNSGFIGIPLMKLWGGAAAVNIIVVYDQFQTFYIFTLGIIIVSGEFTLSGLKEMAKSPLLWSIIGGFLFHLLRIPIQPVLLDTLEFGGGCAPALTIFALGCSVSKRKVRLNGHLLSGLTLRFFIGFAAGWIASELFGIHGLERSVILIASSLPSGMFSVVLPMRYGVDPEFAGSMIVASCISGIFIMPLLIALV